MYNNVLDNYYVPDIALFTQNYQSNDHKKTLQGKYYWETKSERLNSLSFS